MFVENTIPEAKASGKEPAFKKVSEDNRVGGQRRTTNQQGHAAPRHWNRSPDSSKETDTSNEKKGLRQRLNCVNLLVLFTRKSNQRQHFYSAFK